MMNLLVNNESKATVISSFDTIAKSLFCDFQLEVNKHYYRLLDIEFYYYCDKVFEDVYAHKHEAQLQSGKWYFHGSGIDITIGDGINHGGILIRAVAKISGESSFDKNFIEKEIHGPLNVKTEICSKLKGAFEKELNTFCFHNISGDRMGAGMILPKHIIKSKRIGLNSKNDNQLQEFHNGKFRYVIIPYLKLRDKTQIAIDMKQQFPDMPISEINKELGSAFLK